MSNNALFILHPCLYVYFAECDGASLCLIMGNGNVTRLVDYQPWLSSSNFPLLTTGYSPDTGFTSSYTYTDNSTCMFNEDRFGQSVQVVFSCDPFAVPARLTYVSVDYLACHHTAYVNSSYACPAQTSLSSSSSSSSVPYSSTSSSARVLPSPCANAQVNLSTLANRTDVGLYDATTDAYIIFHPCHPILLPECYNTTMCRLYPNGTASTLVGWSSDWAANNYSLSTHTLSDGSTYSYYFSTDDDVSCVVEGLTYPQQVLSMFVCNASVVEGAVLVSVELQQPHPVSVPCQWTVTLQTALACTTPTPPSSTGLSYSSPGTAPSSTSSNDGGGAVPPQPSADGAAFDVNVLASFAVVLLSACLLVVLLIVYRVRARRLLPHSGAVAMHSPSPTVSDAQGANENYARLL